jgi:hypothetical protein
MELADLNKKMSPEMSFLFIYFLPLLFAIKCTVPGVPRYSYRTEETALSSQPGTGRQKNRHCMTVPGLSGYSTEQLVLANQPDTGRLHDGA